MMCGETGCDAEIVRIERYHVTVEWSRQDDGTWDLGTLDNGTHFHLFCGRGHERKVWGRALPDEAQRIVYPGG